MVAPGNHASSARQRLSRHSRHEQVIRFHRKISNNHVMRWLVKFLIKSRIIIFSPNKYGRRLREPFAQPLTTFIWTANIFSGPPIHDEAPPDERRRGHDGGRPAAGGALQRHGDHSVAGREGGSANFTAVLDRSGQTAAAAQTHGARRRRRQDVRPLRAAERKPGTSS